MPTKITKEEFEKLSNYNKTRTWLSNLLYELDVDCGIRITSEEWFKLGYNTLPPTLVASARQNGRKGIIPLLIDKDFSCRTINDGWIILRTK